jgi:predicted ATP-dependent serine protease
MGNIDKQELVELIESKIADLQNDLRELRKQDDQDVTLLELKEFVAKQKPKPKYLTGIRSFDDAMGGLEMGTFVNLAGESGAGKSAFVYKMMLNIAKSNKVLFFNFEMSDRRVINRVRTIDDKTLNNVIVRSKSRAIEVITEDIRTVAEKHQVQFVFIDSMMKIHVSNNKLSQTEKEKYISDRLQNVVQDLDIVLVLINQISNENIKSGYLSVKGAGDQKYDADVELFLIIDKDKDGSEKDKTSRTMVCMKNRDGDKFVAKIPVGDVKIGYTYEIHEFKGDDQ